MKKLMILALLVTGSVLSVSAQDSKGGIELPQWIKNIKLSGYGMLQYQFEDPEGSDHNEFNLRLFRLIADGKIGDVDWRAQLQGTNAKGPGEPTVQLVDLYAEWVKYKDTPWWLITYQVSVTVPERNRVAAVTSVFKYRVMCCPTATVVLWYTTKWVCIMVRASTAKIKTTEKMSLAVYG